MSINSEHPPSRLENFPINLYGAVMGFSGLTLGVQKLVELEYLPHFLFAAIATLTVLIFSLITMMYLIKAIKHPQAVAHDFHHPIAVNFFPAFSISLILISLFMDAISHTAASYFWYLGTGLHLILTIVILNSWIHHEKWQITHMNPAWFIPIVGNILVPLGAVKFGYFELGWFFFSIGFIFWVVLFGIVMYRLFFHPPMMKVLEPTLFIFIAPPAVGFLSYVALLDGQVDAFAKVLYYFAAFLTLMLLTRSIQFIKVPFALSWWAYTFPIAAMAIASFASYKATSIELHLIIGEVLLVILSLLVGHLFIKTLMAVKNKQLCKPHPTPPKP